MGLLLLAFLANELVESVQTASCWSIGFMALAVLAACLSILYNGDRRPYPYYLIRFMPWANHVGNIQVDVSFPDG